MAKSSKQTYLQKSSNQHNQFLENIDKLLDRYWLYQQLKAIGQIIFLFLLTRFAIFLVTYYGIVMFKVFPGVVKNIPDNAWLDGWTRWDGAFYAKIATEGYSTNAPTSTFPGYPILIKIVDFIFQNPFLSGIIVSNIAFLIGLVLLYKLVKNKYGAEVAWRAALYLSVFPTSFFYCSVLSEASYLMFSVAAFYFAEKEKWWWAGLFGLFSLLTRSVGLAIILPLILLYLSKKKYDFRQIKLDLLPILLIPLGILLFMWILVYYGHSPLAFISGQEGWGRIMAAPWWDYGRAFQELISYSGDMFLAGEYPVRLLFHFTLVTVFILLSFLAFKYLEYSYGLYSLFLVLIPLLTPSTKFMLYSDARFIIVAFPIFILLGRFGKNQLGDIFILVFSLLFLALFSIWNGLGGWVS